MIEALQSISFEHPWWFLALVAIPAVWAYQRWRGRPTTLPMTFSDVSMLPDVVSWRQRLLPLLPWLRVAASIALVVALARPRQTLTEEVVKADGIDIMLAIDLSSSMLSRDFDPNRLEVSKRVARDFVAKREHDRVGLALFAGEAYTQCPLTTDHQVVQDFLAGIQVGYLNDGTAIGMGLATAVNRIKDSPAKSKILILLTDGVNNSGYIQPLTAAEIAAEFGVKVYTIGVGSNGSALSPINKTADGRYRYGMHKVEIDEALLKEISSLTGGQYFRAVDESSLDRIYATIDQLEKTEIEVNVFKRYKDQFRWFLAIALLLLVLELLLCNSLLNTEVQV